MPKLSRRVHGYWAARYVGEHIGGRLLDVGTGGGEAADFFSRCGLDVVRLDYGESRNYRARRGTVVCDFNESKYESEFDVLWVSHVLEHQPNAGLFLKRCHDSLQRGGVIAVTVPPLKHEIVGGHVSLWNAGLLLYHLILAGFNCRNAKVKCYRHDISVIARKPAIPFQLPHLSHDEGDIEMLESRFPGGYDYHGFDGNIEELNWQS